MATTHPAVSTMLYPGAAPVAPLNALVPVNLHCPGGTAGNSTIAEYEVAYGRIDHPPALTAKWHISDLAKRRCPTGFDRGNMVRTRATGIEAGNPAGLRPADTPYPMGIVRDAQQAVPTGSPGIVVGTHGIFSVIPPTHSEANGNVPTIAPVPNPLANSVCYPTPSDEYGFGTVLNEAGPKQFARVHLHPGSTFPFKRLYPRRLGVTPPAGGGAPPGGGGVGGLTVGTNHQQAVKAVRDAKIAVRDATIAAQKKMKEAVDAHARARQQNNAQAQAAAEKREKEATEALQAVEILKQAGVRALKKQAADSKKETTARAAVGATTTAAFTKEAPRTRKTRGGGAV